MATDELGPNETIAHYTSQRAELLARLALTRNRGVQVIDAGAKDDLGLDLIVRITEPVLPSEVVPVFGVQVKGTSRKLPNNASADKYVAEHWGHWRPPQFYLFPIVFLLFSVDDDEGYFGWVMRPDVIDGSPTLTKAEVPAMASVKHRALDTVFGRVYKWFGAISKTIVAEANAK
jgi:hypothetical protein